MKKNTPIPEFPEQYKNELKSRIQDDFTTKIAEGVRGVALEVLSVALQDLVRDSDREYTQVRSAAYFFKSTDCNIWYDFLNIEIEDGRAITDKYLKMYVKPGLNAWERYKKKKEAKRNKAIEKKNELERRRRKRETFIRTLKRHLKSCKYKKTIDKLLKGSYTICNVLRRAPS
jgi:hypothetical protein